jgi:hypothetical protein
MPLGYKRCADGVNARQLGGQFFSGSSQLMGKANRLYYIAKIASYDRENDRESLSLACQAAKSGDDPEYLDNEALSFI